MAPGAVHEAPPSSSSRFEAITTLLAGMADTLRLTLLLPLGVGILVSRRLKAQPQASLMALLLVGLYAVLMFGLQMAAGYMSERHLLPLAALAAPWVGAGTICLADRLHALLARGRATWQRLSSRGVLCAVVAIMLLEQARPCLHPLHKRHEPALKAASWVRAHANDAEAVLSNSWYVAFYSGVPGLRIDTPEQLAGLLARHESSRYRYFVLETCEGTGADPAWLDLLQAHYREVAVETLGQRWKVIIFEASNPGKG